jgi:hypothetical protein
MCACVILWVIVQVPRDAPLSQSLGAVTVQKLRTPLGTVCESEPQVQSRPTVQICNKITVLARWVRLFCLPQDPFYPLVFIRRTMNWNRDVLTDLFCTGALCIILRDGRNLSNCFALPGAQTSIYTKSVMLREVTSCSPIEFHRCFGGVHCLHLQDRRISQGSIRQAFSFLLATCFVRQDGGNMPYEMYVKFEQIARRYIPKAVCFIVMAREPQIQHIIYLYIYGYTPYTFPTSKFQFIEEFYLLRYNAV